VEIIGKISTSPPGRFKMQVYTYSEARQKLARVLEQTESVGKVLIRRKDGRIFALVPEQLRSSPLDIPSIKAGISTEEIVSIVRKGRERIKAHVFICVLALQIKRLMRNRLKTLSVSKALDRLRQVKVGEIKVGDTATLLATEVTAEQKEIMRKLAVPALPTAFV
jgi:antitoxin Phd